MSAKIKSQSAKSLGKVVYARLQPKTDLLGAIKEICTEHSIRNGVILCCMGSLMNAVFEYAKGAKGSPRENLEITGSLLLHACQGVICPSYPEGDLVIHLHGSVRDSEGKVYQGHFAEKGNVVSATADIIISDLGIELIRAPDPETGLIVTTVKGS
jgi:predicted DNA-binding protein with PD1-like motif